jgi:hypothetical protein
MTLAQIILGVEPAPIYGQFVRRVHPLGEWPQAPSHAKSEAQRRNARAGAAKRRANRARTA